MSARVPPQPGKCEVAGRLVERWCMGGRPEPFQQGSLRFLHLIAVLPQAVVQMHAGRSTQPNELPLPSHQALEEIRIEVGC